MMIPIAHAVLTELNEHRVKTKAKAAVKVTVDHGGQFPVIF